MFIYETKVEEKWIDYNGHMNVAFYYHAFEHAMIEVWGFIGVDENYRATEGIAIETKEGHIQFINEAKLGDSLRIESQIFKATQQSLLVGQQMFCGENLLSRFGQWSVSSCNRSGQTKEFSKELFNNLMIMKVLDSELPDWLMRRVKINRGG